MIFSGFISNELKEIAEKRESTLERILWSLIKASLRRISNPTIFTRTSQSPISIIYLT
jgi:hypothetical protein